MGLGKVYLQRCFKEYDAILAMSNNMAGDIVKLGCAKQKVITHYHGIDTRLFTSKNCYENKHVLNTLSVASLVPKQGHFVVLKALRYIKQNYAGVQIKHTIIGHGPMARVVKKYVDENNLQDMVELKGYIAPGEQINAHMQRADVFIHHSITDNQGNKEGIPGALVEAMAAGLPVISTWHAGIPEIITHQLDGLLVRERDANLLAEYIRDLYYNTAARKSFGQHARQSSLSTIYASKIWRLKKYTEA
jgi:colanic acid/amylovoran biosynthesis glycosyltransferase